MKTFLKILFGIFIVGIVLSVGLGIFGTLTSITFGLLGTIIGLVFGLLGTLFGILMEIIFSPVTWVIVLLYLFYKYTKRSNS